MLLFYPSCGNTGNGNTGLHKRFVNHRIGSDRNVIRYFNIADDHGAKADIHIISDNGAIIGYTIIADAIVSVKLAILSDPCRRIHNDTAVMEQRQAFSKAVGFNIKTEIISQPVFP